MSSKTGRTVIISLVLAIVVIGSLYSLAAAGKLGTAPSILLNKLQPCQRPITYSIGSFDSRFGISKEDFQKEIDQAAQIWDGVEGKKLFSYSPDGKGILKINLVYDYRQAETQQLQSLGIKIGSTQASYNSLRSDYQTAKAKYDSDKAAFEANVADYNAKKSSYQTEVDYWNGKGGAPSSEYKKLSAEQAQLTTQSNQIQDSQAKLNSEVSDVNAMVDALNTLAKNLNLNADEYNNIGIGNGQEFNEGLYKSSPTSAEVDIYEFQNTDQLLRVLAHELGHSLGMNHVTDPSAIMYYLNESSNEKPTQSDTSQLNKICGKTN